VKLEACKLFSELSPEELATLRPFASELRFPPDKEIFKEGDQGDGVYFVKEGLIEISTLVKPEVRLVYAQVGAGDFFGEMAVLESKPRSACAVARQDSTVYFISRTEMLRLVERSAALSLGLLREISHRLREFDRQYLAEVLQTERLAIIGRFARSIVHDLKNPLNIISITAEMAGMESATQEFRTESKVRIRRQVERISDLISEILEFTEGPGSSVVLAPSNYGTFVGQLIEELRPEVALKSASLELEGTLPEVDLLLNPKRLRRVFYNLIHNATDAMPEGGKIIIRVHPNEKSVVTEIEDTGPGIAPQIAGHLFQAFVSHGKKHGTGLGLSICKRIVEDHHGWISSRTEPGRGAIFCFGLPRLKTA
jgi:signal transduction histidine kinase